MGTNLVILLACLSMIESGDDDKMVGKAGEVSRYQIMPELWDAFGLPLDLDYQHKSDSFAVADLILSRRMSEFRQAKHRQPTTREIYILWNAPTQALKGKVSKRVMERAKRFENLVNAKMKEESK